MPKARPIAEVKKKISKEERQAREEEEAKLKGSADNVSEPMIPMDEGLRKIREWLVAELGDTLSNKDRVTLDSACIIIDRLQKLDMMTMENFDLVLDSKFSSNRHTVFMEYMKVCNELGLSQVSRARIASSLVQNRQEKKPDPLMELLMDEED